MSSLEDHAIGPVRPDFQALFEAAPGLWDKLQRVLLNLLSNTFRFTPDGGHIKMAVTAVAGQAVFTVADSGPGIPADKREVVFQAFRQLDEHEQRRFGGTGMGLAIAHHFAARHGGQIKVGDAAEGGAPLTLTLPLKAPAGAAVHAEPPGGSLSPIDMDEVHLERGPRYPVVHDQPKASDERPLVLVVDDNSDMNHFICQSLVAAGYQTATASNGMEGLAQVRQLRPQLIVTDQMMPAVDGIEMIAQIRAEAQWDQTPIVVLSAKADDALRLLECGAQDFLIKPFAAPELVARVGNLIRSQTLVQALRSSQEQIHELFEQAFDGIFIAGPDGRYNQINDAGCALMGEPREQLAGKTSFDLIPPAQHERMREVRQTLLQGQGEVHVHEWLLHRKDGTMLPVEVKARLLSDGRWVSFVRDISAHKRELQARETLAEQLEAHVHRRTEQLRRMGADLEAAEDRERRKIAHDLHDDLGQTLAAARIWLTGLCAHKQPEISRPAHEIDKLIDRANRSTRSLAAQLAPAMLYELGLSPALEWLGEDVSATFGMKVKVEDDGQPKPLSQNARSILYRATRELLINAAKHARSPTAAVHISREDNHIVVRVSDAGVGFDPAQVDSSPERGMGLLSVRERLSFIEGTVEIRSAPGKGTEAVLRALLQDESSDNHRDGQDALDLGPGDALQSIIDALAGRVAVFDQQGNIRCVNRAWREFARAHGVDGGIHMGPGGNYLEICRQCAQEDPHAAKALEGLLAVMQGDLPEFAHVYPCHASQEQHWFMMHAAPLIDGDCLVTHIELSDWVDPERMAALDISARGVDR
ncbi:MAG: ATP-binding protein [Acidobacteriota bacterium]